MAELIGKPIGPWNLLAAPECPESGITRGATGRIECLVLADRVGANVSAVERCSEPLRARISHYMWHRVSLYLARFSLIVALDSSRGIAEGAAAARRAR